MGFIHRYPSSLGAAQLSDKIEKTGYRGYDYHIFTHIVDTTFCTKKADIKDAIPTQRKWLDMVSITVIDDTGAP